MSLWALGWSWSKGRFTAPDPCRQRGCETLTSLLERTNGASTMPKLSLLEAWMSLQKVVTVSGTRSAAAAEMRCPKCTGSIKKSLAKTAPCALPAEMFVLLGELRHRNGSGCPRVAERS